MKRLVLILLALPTLSFAQSTESDSDAIDPDSGRQIIYQKATQIDFEGIDVDAALSRPGIGLIGETRHKGFIPMITLRHDFNAEMNASIDDVK